ncbi:MAG: MFS transporter, partial [Candidatus Hodarchaeales archaeon]
VLVDRYNRKAIIIIVDFLQALVTLLLVYLFWAEIVTITHILLILAARAFLQAFHMPATEAIVPLMVPKDKLSRINGLRQFSDGASGIIGPVLAVFLLNYWEIRLILLLDPLTFILAIIPVLFIEIPSPKKKKEKKEKLSFKVEFSEGISFILKKPGLLPLILLFSVLNFFFNPLLVLLPMFIIQTHAKGKDEIAFMMVLLQIGYISGSILMMVWKGFKRKILGTILAMV